MASALLERTSAQKPKQFALYESSRESSQGKETLALLHSRVGEHRLQPPPSPDPAHGPRIHRRRRLRNCRVRGAERAASRTLMAAGNMVDQSARRPRTTHPTHPVHPTHLERHPAPTVKEPRVSSPTHESRRVAHHRHAVRSFTTPRSSVPAVPAHVPMHLSVSMPSAVRVVEVAPRDGLQNESVFLDARHKVALVHDLVDAGLQTVEVTAFVSPRSVPQLADAADVFAAVRTRPGVTYSALVPNMRGMRAAVAAGARHIAVFASATEQFSMHNLNCSIQQSLDKFAAVTAHALARGIKVRGYVSCVVGCPYQGHVDPHAVADVAIALWQMGCYEISLGDTIGAGNPKSIVRVVHAVLSRGVPISAIAIHCHDTHGMALANVLAAMSVGVQVVDSSVAGLGGCPFAPGAAGNLATEDLLYMLQGMGIDVGPIDPVKVADIGKRICALLKRRNRSRAPIAMACDKRKPHTERSSF